MTFGMEIIVTYHAELTMGLTMCHYHLRPNSVEAREMKQYPVRALGGKIMYLAENTRPEIKLAIGKISRYFHNPHMVHWKGLVVLAMYLRKHVNYGIIYRKGEDSGEADDAKSLLFNYHATIQLFNWMGRCRLGR